VTGVQTCALPIWSYRYIGVCGRRQGHTLILTVADNGVGMDEATIERVLNEDIPPESSRAKLGINLVHKRLKYIYGPEYGIQIRSAPGSGCAIHVMLEASEDASRYSSLSS
jgi:two-component system sensor histidine kinase YesM